jgi:hypothetical protein
MQDAQFDLPTRGGRFGPAQMQAPGHLTKQQILIMHTVSLVTLVTPGPCGCRPFTEKERGDLQFLYDEWAHPFFISKEEFVRLMNGTGQLQECKTEDWCEQTIPSWRQSIWVGVESPWKVIFKFNPFIWWKVIREIVTLERMHRAFASGLMEYGVIPIPVPVPPGLHVLCGTLHSTFFGRTSMVWTCLVAGMMKAVKSTAAVPQKQSATLSAAGQQYTGNSL